MPTQVLRSWCPEDGLDTGHPFRFRVFLRGRLPRLLLGLFPKGDDCESVGGWHRWYNHDDARSACYHCKVVVDGQRWREPE